VSLAISEKALGPEHPDSATNLIGLALLLAVQGDLSAQAHHRERPKHPPLICGQDVISRLAKQGDASASLFETRLNRDERNRRTID
jgi:hypothetical protein